MQVNGYARGSTLLTFFENKVHTVYQGLLRGENTSALDLEAHVACYRTVSCAERSVMKNDGATFMQCESTFCKCYFSARVPPENQQRFELKTHVE